MWQHNVYYTFMTFSVVRYVGLNIPHHTEHHAHIINVMLPHHHDWLLWILNSVIFQNSVTLTRHRQTPWWWSIKIETCRSVPKCLKVNILH